jgi:hypothetical protein
MTEEYFDLAYDAVNAFVKGDMDWFKECLEEMMLEEGGDL